MSAAGPAASSRRRWPRWSRVDRVAAVDTSEGVLEVCRERVPEADVRVASAEVCRSPRVSSTGSSHSSSSIWSTIRQEQFGRWHESPAPEASLLRASGTTMKCRCFARCRTPLELWLHPRWRRSARRRRSDCPISNCSASGGATLDCDVVLGEFEVRAGESFDDLWAPFEAGVGHSGTLCRRCRPNSRRRCGRMRIVGSAPRTDRSGSSRPNGAGRQVAGGLG